MIWLDYPLWLVEWRLFIRTTRRIIAQEELWAGNRESFRNAFLSRDSLFLFAVTSQRKHRSTYPLELQRPEHAHLHVFHFHAPHETQAWLDLLAVNENG